ncbi:MAG TPA: cytochrome b N-terminal domain-containing protein [Candidatus Obscuribacterales bacterium]
MKIIDTVVQWLDERTGLREPIVQIMAHPVPPGSKWAYVFGTATLTCFIVQIVTGIALSNFFVPSAGDAFESLRFITERAPFGKLIRGMHYFGASAMILFVGVHALRTFLWGSFKFPREMNWLSGVFLLFLTVAMGFTGQILRWDQNAVWTVSVGAEQALRAPFIGKFAAELLLTGGDLGSTTFGHFFSAHVFLLPGVLIAIIVFHVWLVLFHGISEPPVPGETIDPKTYKQKYEEMLKRIGKPFWPDAAWRDVVFSTGLVIAILLCAIFFGAPELQNPPDPSIVQASPKPDWYLIWYFALLALLPHESEDWVIIGFPALVFLLFLSVPFWNNRGERSYKRRPWSVGIVLFILAFVGSLWLKGVHGVWTPKFTAIPLTPQVVGASSGPIYEGAKVFNSKGCLYCHTYAGRGGQRGPDLTFVSSRLTHDQLVVRILNGGYNMPSYAANISPKDLQALTTFLESKRGETAPLEIQPSEAGGR